eukprot:TRINITY_DN45_c0_g1_i1.p1 TRINITY_DN45_c0_g1~~TRINITY_DN45_c0_g1_i1.p1  ORF type:complete len:227 (+),score=39.99 TRINITY_DN45_c0_g1_i1:70-681(+)
MEIEEEQGAPVFPPVKPSEVQALQHIAVKIPKHRMTPLKDHWMEIYQPIVEHLKLQIRFNTSTSSVEIRTSPEFTTDVGSLQKAADFVKAFSLGFEVADSLAMLRMEDIFIESFAVEDVKTLQGDSMARAVGRIAGKDGKTKFTIENATRTRIVLADKKIHIMGTFQNIKVARDAICSLILGSPPGKVYGKLRVQSARLREAF